MPAVSATLFWLALAALLVTLTLLSARAARRAKRARALFNTLRADGQSLLCVYPSGMKAQVVPINGGRAKWRPFVLDVRREGITLYDIIPRPAVRFTFAPAELRWFGRPRVYASSGPNEIWLHVERDGQWWWIKLRLARVAMQGLVRALKQIAAPELVTAYRRRRPYVHAGPVRAAPATQDLLGAWTLGPPISLYLTPLQLVILEGAQVQRVIPLEHVQAISAVRRLDRPGAAGLLRFEVQGEPLAFALEQHEAFAVQLAEAARRTLEDPVLWQRKKKKEELSEAEWEDVLLDEEALGDEPSDGELPYALQEEATAPVRHTSQRR